jgi:formylglycine-generating enzyme required for sulfatase activity
MKQIFLSISAFLISFVCLANNITVANATLSGQNIVAHTEIVNFDISWENSWRTSTNESNYDGAWVFVKFRKMGTTDWRHCTINTAGAVIGGAGGVIQVQNDKKGAFIYRAADGIGNVNYTANQMVWNYGTDGILDNETVEIRVFALEMVYIPQGSFLAGSGGTDTYGINTAGSSPVAPYLVATNGAITVGAVAGNMNASANMTSGTIPAAFPKGFSAFWIMKYEVSQQQYADFLNNLDNARAVANYANILTGTNPNYVAPQPECAMQYMGVNSTSALADWSALRPYTELEFEKTCRGYNTPALPNEYVWGSTSIFALTAVANTGLVNESVATPSTANVNILTSAQGGYGAPARTGLFARTTGSTRELSGSAYYGVMNMADNLYETVVTSGTTAGRAITEAIHGDGFLSASGASDVPTWIVAGAYGLKGAYYAMGAANFYYAQTSDRTSIANGGAASVATGARLARTAQ